MPSTTRRRLLASLGAGAATGLAGCTDRLTGPRDVDAVETGEGAELVWEYPAAAVDDGSDGAGYTAVRFEGERATGRGAGALEFQLNTTVGGIAASEPYDGFEADWARFRLGPPGEYDATHQYRMWVQPPTWPGLDVGYDRRGGRRELVIETAEIDAGGTITFPVVFEPVEAVPERFHCSFTVQASEPGLFGESVRAGCRGVVDVPASDSS